MQSSFPQKLQALWQTRQTYICVGLDPDLSKIPKHLLKEKNSVFEFNKNLIEATSDLVCSYKPQMAYYSGQRLEDQLHMTMDFLKSFCPEIPVILDSKRGDIGSTAEQYAKEAFEVYGADAVTVNPYMGLETVEPFLSYADKGVFVLCKTSNPGSGEFQNLQVAGGKRLFEIVAQSIHDKSKVHSGLGLVVGATHVEDIKSVRALASQVPFLIPGVGAQGGSVHEVVKSARSPDGHGLLINSSRGIIYASADKDYAAAARKATIQLKNEIALALES